MSAFYKVSYRMKVNKKLKPSRKSSVCSLAFAHPEIYVYINSVAKMLIDPYSSFDFAMVRVRALIVFNSYVITFYINGLFPLITLKGFTL